MLRDPLYPGVAEATSHAGECLLSAPDGDRTRAEDYLQRALASNPELPGALRGMARLRYAAGNYLSARGFLQRYFDVGQETPKTLLLAVRVELALNATDAARERAERLKRSFPRSSEAAELANLNSGALR